MLLLRTGETVKLQGNYEKDQIILLAEATADSVAVIDHFVELTGFPADR